MGQCRNCQKLKVPDMKEWFKNVRHRLAYLIAPDWIEDLESRLSSLLCHCTGYKLSKSYYPTDTMIRAADDHQQSLCAECEKIAECENLRQKFKTAIEKQQAQQVELTEDECLCLSCGFDMMGCYDFTDTNHIPKHCPECGQKLDWRKDNEYKPD